MTYLAPPVTSHLCFSTAPARPPRGGAPINPILFHDDIVRPELRNDAILAATEWLNDAYPAPDPLREKRQ